jgi:hypothetical protein
MQIISTQRWIEIPSASDVTKYPINTFNELDFAEDALRDVGIPKTNIWAQDPNHCDAYKTNDFLYAAIPDEEKKGMHKRVKRPKLGEYVLVSKWPDCSLFDPWGVGILTAIKEYVTPGSITPIFGYQVGHALRWYRYCWRITEQEGAARIAEAKVLEADGHKR